MSNYRVAAVLAALALASAAPRNSKTILMQEHYMQVFNFSCEKPQIRAVQLDSLMALSSGASYVPPVTVLRLCDAGSGCCPQRGTACGPLLTERVERIFRVTRMLPSGGTNVSLESYTFTQHASCSCRPQVETLGGAPLQV